MITNLEVLTENKIHQLVAANHKAIKALRSDIERLKTVLELKSLRAASAEERLRQSIRDYEAALNMLLMTGQDLQAQLDARVQARQSSAPQISFSA